MQHLRPALVILGDAGHDAWILLALDDRAIGQRPAAAAGQAIEYSLMVVSGSDSRSVRTMSVPF